MKSLLLRHATPYVTALFLVSLISGLALFFHIGPAGVHGMHEWLSLLLILPFVLHLWKNWRPMTTYLRGLPMALALIITCAMAAVFLIPTQGAARGGNPMMALMTQVMASSPRSLAPILGTTAEGMAQTLTAAGFTVTSPDQPLSDLAAQSGKSTMALAAALTAGE